MRKRIGTGLLAFLMLATLLAVPALADEPERPKVSFSGIWDLHVSDNYEVNVLTADGSASEFTDGVYKDAAQLEVTISNATDGSFYLVTTQKDSQTPKQENLVYINQKTAESGTVVFAFASKDSVYPSSLADGSVYYVMASDYNGTSAGALTVVASFRYFTPYAMGNVTGEVLGDKAVDLTDALWVMQSYAGNREFSDVQNTVGNVTGKKMGDKAVDLTDALWIMQAYAGNRDLE